MLCGLLSLNLKKKKNSSKEWAVEYGGVSNFTKVLLPVGCNSLPRLCKDSLCSLNVRAIAWGGVLWYLDTCMDTHTQKLCPVLMTLDTGWLTCPFKTVSHWWLLCSAVLFFSVCTSALSRKSFCKITSVSPKVFSILCAWLWTRAAANCTVNPVCQLTFYLLRSWYSL